MRIVTVTDTDMLPAASQDAQTLLFWVEEAVSDPIVSKVLTTKAFKRLRGEITPGKELSDILKNGVDIEFIVRLISGRYAILDAFWHLKDFVYKYIIHSKNGLLADFKARAYFEDIQSSIHDMALLVSEKQWRKNYKCLFDQLSDQADIPQPVINFTQHHYVIFDSYRGDIRYRVERGHCSQLSE